MIRKEVADFVALGALPDETAEVAVIQRHEQALLKILPPVSEDARVLLPRTRPSESDNQWAKLLWDRAHR